MVRIHVSRERLLVFAGIAAVQALLGCGQSGGTTTSPTTDKPAPITVERQPLAAGFLHACGLTADGTAYCWGKNEEGELGRGAVSAGPNPTPQPVATAVKFVAISGGGAHTCALTAEGMGYCWGRGTNGQLGNGNLASTATPTLVDSSLRFIQLSAGLNHTCAVASNGKGYCWGYGAFGQIGDGNIVSRNAPTEVVGLPKLKQIFAGESHSCGLSTTGALYCWGAGSNGQLGTGSQVNTAAPIGVGGAMTFSWIGLGLYNGCAMGTDAHAYCWGMNNVGQLGLDSTDSNFHPPTEVAKGLGAVRIYAGGRDQTHVCASAANGDIYCWGYNDRSQLGVGITGGWVVHPTKIVSAVPLSHISLGGLSFSCALSNEGAPYCWGWNNYGQLGNTTMGESNTPIIVSSTLAFK